MGLEECLLKITAGCGRISAREMPRRTQYQDRIELMQGTLDMLVLRTLQWGSQHGHGIGQAIRARSEEALQIEHGSLYPALHRLEQRGWLKAEWKASEANRRAKYYSLSQAGKKQLLREESKWNALVETIARVMKPA
jgi:PadR family transcriptional regulator, regulatory protein PadR